MNDYQYNPKKHTVNNYQYDQAIAAEAERRALIMQAVREHESNATTEMRRFLAELDHINNVCDARTGETS